MFRPCLGRRARLKAAQDVDDPCASVVSNANWGPLLIIFDRLMRHDEPCRLTLPLKSAPGPSSV